MKGKNKVLVIELEENVYNMLKNYCKDTGVEFGDMCYLFGALEKGSTEHRKMLTDLTNAFFFAGMHTAIDNKKVYKHYFLNPEKLPKGKENNYFG